MTPVVAMLYTVRMIQNKKAIDMVGARVGHLTVVRYAGPSKEGATWECRCDCGAVVVRPRWRLKKDHPNISCGCVSGQSKEWIGARDLTGKTYGWLTVVGKSGASNDEWECVCKCGGRVVKKWYSLERRNVHPEFNCGCHKHGYKAGGFEAVAMAIVVSGIKGTMARRGLGNELSDEEIAEITKRPCAYCGVVGGNVRKKFKSPWVGREYRYNGIDRVDNSLGYTKANVVPCCGECNEGKMDRSPDEYVRHCIAVADYNRKTK